MLPLLLAASLAIAQAPDTAHVVLVATTDVHGRATGWDYLARRPSSGGLARVAPVVDSLRRRYPGQVVVLDGGDLLQGDPFATYHARVRPVTPHPVIEAMNLVGYDAATPGNHDFDFGAPLLYRTVGEARFPYVSANIYDERGDTLVFAPFRVLQRQGVRVSVTGFTTPGVMVWDRAHLKGRIRVEPIDRTAAATLRAMRRESDLTVVLSHSGMDGRATYDTTGIGAEHATAELAALPVRPDVVVVGHSHREMTDSVLSGVHFVQPRRHAAGLSIVHVDLRRKDGRWRVARIRGEALSVADRPISPLLAQRLRASHEAVQEWVDEPIGVAAAPLRAKEARARPVPVMDFILETQRRRAGADLASGPAFDLRAGFDADTIRRGQVLALYPYDNTLRAVRLSGEQLRSYLEWSARYFVTDPAGRISLSDSVAGYDYDLIRGARYELDLLRPPGERVRSLSVRGKPVQPADSFTLALNSHRQTGAGGYGMLRGAPVVYDRNENIPELLVEEIRSRGVLDPSAVSPSEWRIVPEVAARAVGRIFDVAPDPEPVSPRDSVLLRILATADLNGDLLRRAAPLVRAMDSLGADCQCPTLRLDTGDALAGGLASSATDGRALLETLEQMGYAAAVLGDREFDWPLDTLRRRIAESRHPWVAGNVFDSVSARRPEWLTPYRMVEAGGMRVAVLGYVTPAAKAAHPPERTRGLRIGDGELALHDVLGQVRSERPGLTILLAHASASCDSVVCTGEAIRLAEQLGGSGVDLVLAGQASGRVDTRVSGMPVVGSGGSDALTVVDLVKTASGGRALRARVAAVPPGAPPAAAGSPLDAALERLARRSDSLERRVVAQVKRPLRRNGAQHALGALIAEARRNAVRADLGLVRDESIRADLPAGAVTFARLAEVEPSGAALVRVTLTGAQLRSLLEQAVGGQGLPAVHLAGATVRCERRSRAGRRIKSVTFLGGRPLRAEERYSLTTDDSTAAGAGGLAALRDLQAERVGLLDVEAVAGYLRRLPQPVEVGSPPGLCASS